MRRPRTRAAGWLTSTGLVLALLTGCGSSDSYQAAGPWQPLLEGEPPVVGPPAEQAPVPAPTNPSAPGEPDDPAEDPNVVASGLAVPTGLVVLPDGTAIVGERETGRLLKVFPDHSPAQELMTVPVDTSGDGGLLGLALSPTYAEDGLLYAYVSTATDNQVVRFPIGGTPNPVLTGIPRGETHNGGGLLFGRDGTLYIGTGDTGDAALAQDPASLAGKVLAVDVFGQPVNATPVYSTGLADVTALCLAGDGGVLATDDAAAAGADELDAIASGADYGWPTRTHDSVAPVTSYPGDAAGLGGCAITGSTVFLGALDGQRVIVQELDGQGLSTGDPTDVLAGQYGRLRTVVLDAQGGLWITTSNRDGIGTPGAEDDKVLRIVAPTSTGNSPL